MGINESMISAQINHKSLFSFLSTSLLLVICIPNENDVGEDTDRIVCENEYLNYIGKNRFQTNSINNVGTDDTGRIACENVALLIKLNKMEILYITVNNRRNDYYRLCSLRKITHFYEYN